MNTVGSYSKKKIIEYIIIKKNLVGILLSKVFVMFNVVHIHRPTLSRTSSRWSLLEID